MECPPEPLDDDRRFERPHRCRRQHAVDALSVVLAPSHSSTFERFPHQAQRRLSRPLPDLVPVAGAIFDKKFGKRENQKDELKADGLQIKASELLPREVPGGRVTEEGVNGNISVALHYLCSWLQGQGAVAINNLMEDAATAEIARAELWQWVKREIPLGSTRLTRDEFRRRLSVERASFAGQAEKCRLNEACDLLTRLVLNEEFASFLTLSAYDVLEN